MEKKRRREFMVLFLLIFAVHIFMEIDFNDDQVYTGIIRKKDLWQTLVYSYESGRELFCRYWYSVLYGFLRKFAGGFLCMLGGLSLGREGPSIQLGAMAGQGISRALGRGKREEKFLMTCGASAGLSAAFHAPLAGIDRKSVV